MEPAEPAKGGRTSMTKKVDVYKTYEEEKQITKRTNCNVNMKSYQHQIKLPSKDYKVRK